MGIPPAGKRDCYWAFKFERKEQLLVFEVSTGTMLDVYHLDIDSRDIMFFIYHWERRLVESRSNLLFERKATSFVIAK